MPPIKLARKSCRCEGRRRFMTMVPGCDSSSHHGWRFDGGGKRRHQKQYHDSKLVRFVDFDWQTMAETEIWEKRASSSGNCPRSPWLLVKIGSSDPKSVNLLPRVNGPS